MNMQTVKALIDAAIRRASSQTALAEAIGWKRSEVSELATGKRPISPEIVGLLADYVGLTGAQAQHLAALAVVENPKNAARAETLRRAFFPLAAVGATVLWILLLLHSNNAEAASNRFQLLHGATSSTMYKLSRIWHRLKHKLRTIGVALRAGLYGYATKPDKKPSVSALRVTIPNANTSSVGHLIAQATGKSSGGLLCLVLQG